jgi:hypothetical protein
MFLVLLTETVPGQFGETFPVVGMRDVNQGMGTLFQVFAVQINYAILGYYKMNVRPGSDYSCTFFKCRYQFA